MFLNLDVGAQIKDSCILLIQGDNRGNIVGSLSTYNLLVFIYSTDIYQALTISLALCWLLEYPAGNIMSPASKKTLWALEVKKENP